MSDTPTCLKRTLAVSALLRFCRKLQTLGLRNQAIGLQIHPIQPDSYRAPEVLLGVGWSYSADIWNLGVMV